MIRDLANLSAWIWLIARLTWAEDLPRFAARGVYVSAIAAGAVAMLAVSVAVVASFAVGYTL